MQYPEIGKVRGEEACVRCSVYLDTEEKEQMDI